MESAFEITEHAQLRGSIRDGRFRYILALSKQDTNEESLLYGFTPGVMGSLPLVKAALRLPQHVLQLGMSRDDCTRMRISGGTYQILPAVIDALTHLPIGPTIPFWCLLSNDETYEFVKGFVARHEHSILHVSTVRAPDCIYHEGVEWSHLFRLFQSVFARCTLLTQHRWARELAERSDPPVWNSEILDVEEREHYCTLPNELTLQSLRYEFARREPLVASNSDTTYVRAIVESAGAVQKIRDKLKEGPKAGWPPSLDLILFAPAFYSRWYKTELKPVPAYPIARKMLQAYIQQKHYYLEGSKLPLKSIQSVEFGEAIAGYRTEMETQTVAVGVRAAGTFAPVLRLPPGVNHLHSTLSQLGQCARGNSPHVRFKLNKVARKFKEQLLAAVPAEFYPFIDRPNNRIKIVGNIPLEWLPVRNLPLMIRYETSRVPSTPGNATFLYNVSGYEMGLSASAFREVLIIRSYSENDPVKTAFQNAVQIYERHKSERVQARLVDVADVDGFIGEVNRFNQALMVFDGHGAASTLKEVGGIVLGGRRVDIWQYREKIRVPPIVILSACDTHAIDGIHASVANAFLMLGARAVLATALPIHAHDAAVFIVRLLIRVQEYIPIVCKRDPVRWSTIVTGFLRMVYISDFLEILKEHFPGRLAPQEWLMLQMGCNDLIFHDNERWYEKSLALCEHQTGVNQEEISEAIEKWGQMPSAIQYTHLGNPEQILIFGDEVSFESTLTPSP